MSEGVETCDSGNGLYGFGTKGISDWKLATFMSVFLNFIVHFAHAVAWG